MLEDDFLAVGTYGETRVVNVHNNHFELHFWFELAGAGVNAITGVELHVLDCFFGFIGEFGLKFKAARHIALDFVASGNAGCRLLLGCRWRGRFGGFFSLFYPSFLTSLELLSWILFYQTGIFRICFFR